MKNVSKRTYLVTEARPAARNLRRRERLAAPICRQFHPAPAGLLLAGVLAIASMGANRGYAETTPWNEGINSQARLHTARYQDQMFAAIEIRLKPGWKTYWRTPGETGFSPSLKWVGSENVEDVELLFPAPRWFDAFGYDALGYKTGVTFPIRVTPSDDQVPIKLDLSINMLVCGNLCIPARYAFGPLVLQTDEPASFAIHSAMAKVPVALSGGLDRILRSEIRPKELLLKIDMSGLPFKDAEPFLVLGEIEGLDPLIAHEQQSVRGILQVHFPVDGPLSAGTDLRITIIGSKRAIELQTNLGQQQTGLELK